MNFEEAVLGQVGRDGFLFGCGAYAALVSLPKGSSPGMGTFRTLPQSTKRIGVGLGT